MIEAQVVTLSILKSFSEQGVEQAKIAGPALAMCCASLDELANRVGEKRFFEIANLDAIVEKLTNEASKQTNPEG
jgi:hypothetical protein